METDKKITSSSSENHNLQIAMRHVSNLTLDKQGKNNFAKAKKKFLCNQNNVILSLVFVCQHIFLHKYLNNCHREILHSPSSRQFMTLFNCKILNVQFDFAKKKKLLLFCQAYWHFPVVTILKVQAPLVNSRLSVHRAVIGLLNSKSCIEPGNLADKNRD